MSITYKVGPLLSQDDADPALLSLHDATEAALLDSNMDYTLPFGVWTGEEHGRELVSIAYQGSLYTSTLRQLIEETNVNKLIVTEGISGVCAAINAGERAAS